MGPYSTWGISSNRLTDITAIGRALLLANDKVTAKEILGVTGGGGEGPPGPPGPEGPQGPQGVPGAQGPAGADGAQGPAGADGAQGPQGIQGIPGSAGAPGADGADGAQGPQGDAGPQGIQGAQGNPGSPGSPGADGNDGAQGPQGIQGIQGIQGPQGPAGAGGGMTVTFVADGAALALTNMALALGFLAASHRFATKADLTAFTQCRLIVNKQATAGAAASKIILRYITAFSTTAASWLDAGTSEVSVAINVQNTVLVTAWTNLAEGAKADVFLCPLMSGGDGALDPTVGHIEAQFK